MSSNIEGLFDAARNINASADSVFLLLSDLHKNGLNEDFDRAVAWLENEPAYRGSLRLALEKAKVLRDRGDLEGSMALLKEIQRKHPRNGHAFRIHSDILISQDRLLDAWNLLREAWASIDEENLKSDIIYRILKIENFMNSSRLSKHFIEPKLQKRVLNAVCIMMVRDEGDIISSNLIHHFNMGFRKFVLIDNNSFDSTKEDIETFSKNFSDAVVIYIKDPVAGYFQGEKTNAAAQFAKNYFSGIGDPVDWIFIFDADEFLLPPDEGCDLYNFLETINSDTDFICFPLIDACSSILSNYDPNATNLYAHFSVIAVYPKTIVHKNAFRAGFECRVTTGNHVLDSAFLDPARALAAASKGWALLHLPCRSQSQMARKILNGASAIEARGDAAPIGGHWMALAEQMRADPAATAMRRMQSHLEETLHGAHRVVGRFKV